MELARLPATRAVAPARERLPASLLVAWLGAALLLMAGAGALAWISPRFGYAHAVADMPVAALVAGLVTAGALFAVGVPWLAAASAHLGPSRPRDALVLLMLAAGLAARLVLVASEPVLEDDYQRYLWDGAVTAAGFNPYRASPERALAEGRTTELGRLTRAGGATVERINHRDLRTIYPPVAQGAFALAHRLAPWSLIGWRLVLLGAEIATVLVLLLLLAEVGRSPLWAAFYWWSPVVLKEIANSAHMDAILMPLVLAALLLSVRGRALPATLALGVAAGAKIWPILLAPLILMPLLADRRRLLMALALLAGLGALWAWPVLAAGLDDSSGFVAYLDRWKTNSALFPVLEAACAWLAGHAGLDPEHGGRIARALIAAALVVFAAAIGWHRRPEPADVVHRAALIVAALVLLAPAQYPWYTVWLAPLLAFHPWPAFRMLTALIPLYYLFFHFAGRDRPEVQQAWVVWILWVPVWLTLAGQGLTAWRRNATGASPG